VFVVVIAFGCRLSARLLQTLSNVQKAVKSEVFFIGNESLFTRAKNFAVAEFLGSSHTHILFVHSPDLDIKQLVENIELCYGYVKCKDDWMLIDKNIIRAMTIMHPALQYTNDMSSLNTARSKDNFYAFFDDFDKWCPITKRT